MKNHRLPYFDSEDNSLYFFSRSRLLVVQGWPELRAWKWIHGTASEGDPCFYFGAEDGAGKFERFRKFGELTNEIIMGPVAGHSEDFPEVNSSLPIDWTIKGKIGKSALRTETAPSSAGGGHACVSGTKEAIQAFGARFPEAVISALKGHRNRSQWKMAKQMAKLCSYPGGMDLLRSNHGLAFALLNAEKFQQVDDLWQEIPRHLNRPRREVAGWLGFPPTESTVRLLSKVAPNARDPEQLSVLRHFLNHCPNQDLINALRHLPLIRRSVMEFLAPRYWPFMRGSDLTKTERDDYCLNFIDDTLNMAERLNCLHRVETLHSLADVKKLHDELVKELNAAYFEKECANPFPPPPFPGNNHIVPITSAQELAEEGREMEHCVYSYIDSVREGQHFIYRVLTPERATVSVRRTLPKFDGDTRTKEWVIDQLKGKRNDSVSAECERTVADWFETAQISLSE